MYSLLVIDDQNHTENRKSIYEFMFTDGFEISCIDSEEKNLLDALEKRVYDCIILDNNLDKGLEKNEVLDLLKEYNYPVIMVSNVREFTLREGNQSSIIDFISLNQYFALRDLQENPTENNIKEKELIKKCLRDLHERINLGIYRKSCYENCNKKKLVLGHISDIQFCDPHVEDNALRTLFGKLEEFIINMDSPIDILIISGDIVFSGKRKEFEFAGEVIKKFMDKLKRQRKTLEIMFVPGNHDFDYQCFWLKEEEKCNLDLENVSTLFETIKNGEENKLFENKLTPNLFKDFFADSIYLNNFKQFAFELTGDSAYLNKDFYLVNRKYIKTGFSLVGFNNAYKYHKNKAGLKRYIFELDSDIVDEIKRPLLSIAIGHIDPMSLGYKNICSMQEDRCNDTLFKHECSEKGQCEKWGDMERLFARTHSIMYLSGHKHSSDIEISKNNEMLLIGAGAPTGANPCEKTMNIIEIEKIEEKIQVRISLHRANPEKISFLQLQDFEYDMKTNRWEQN